MLLCASFPGIKNNDLVKCNHGLTRDFKYSYKNYFSVDSVLVALELKREEIENSLSGEFKRNILTLKKEKVFYFWLRIFSNQIKQYFRGIMQYFSFF